LFSVTTLQANASQCYVIRTLLILFPSIFVKFGPAISRKMFHMKVVYLVANQSLICISCEEIIIKLTETFLYEKLTAVQLVKKLRFFFILDVPLCSRIYRVIINYRKHN
jgi:hypothetical protein